MWLDETYGGNLFRLLRDGYHPSNQQQLGYIRVNVNVLRHSSTLEFIAFNAATYGKLNTLKWAHQQELFVWNSMLYSRAALNGRLQVVQWAHQNGCHWESEICSSAAINGHLGVLQWAHKNGCAWNSSTCSEAASNGHLDVLQWARKAGCVWDSRDLFQCCSKRPSLSSKLGSQKWLRLGFLRMLRSCKQGQYRMLKWAPQNNCEWDIRTCLSDEQNGHLTVLLWPRENDTPHDESMSSLPPHLL
jgi:hypothetical protein